MNFHTAELTQRLNDYLARRTPPRGFAGDDSLKASQMGEYISILRRFAPDGERLTEWWDGFLGRLADESETWAWPAPKDVARAARACNAASARGGSVWQPDSVAINLRRLNEDLPIGEDWLWGAGAIRLEAAGASRVTLRERRQRMAEAMAKVYSYEEVRTRLIELKARHEEARACLDDMQRRHYEVEIPSKRAFSEAQMQSLRELVA